MSWADKASLLSDSLLELEAGQGRSRRLTLASCVRIKGSPKPVPEREILAHEHLQVQFNNRSKQRRKYPFHEMPTRQDDDTTEGQTERDQKDVADK